MTDDTADTVAVSQTDEDAEAEELAAEEAMIVEEQEVEMEEEAPKQTPKEGEERTKPLTGPIGSKKAR